MRQPLSRIVIPWSHTEDVTVDNGGGLVISLADGRDLPVFGFGGSLIGSVTGGIRAKRARDGILAARPEAPSGIQSDKAGASTIAVYWCWAVATVPLLVLADVIASRHTNIGPLSDRERRESARQAAGEQAQRHKRHY